MELEPVSVALRSSICMKFATPQTSCFFVLCTNNFFSPFSQYFRSSNCRRMHPTLSGCLRASFRVRSLYDCVEHWMLSVVNAYAFPNRLRGWLCTKSHSVESVCAHLHLQPAKRLQIVQFAIAAWRQQSSV